MYLSWYIQTCPLWGVSRFLGLMVTSWLRATMRNSRYERVLVYSIINRQWLYCTGRDSCVSAPQLLPLLLALWGELSWLRNPFISGRLCVCVCVCVWTHIKQTVATHRVTRFQEETRLVSLPRYTTTQDFLLCPYYLYPQKDCQACIMVTSDYMKQNSLLDAVGFCMLVAISDW